MTKCKVCKKCWEKFTNSAKRIQITYAYIIFMNKKKIIYLLTKSMSFGPFSRPVYSKCHWDLGHDAGLHIMNVPNHQATTLEVEVVAKEPSLANSHWSTRIENWPVGYYWSVAKSSINPCLTHVWCLFEGRTNWDLNGAFGCWDVPVEPRPFSALFSDWVCLAAQHLS